MVDELLISVSAQETQVSVIENGILQEMHIDRGDSGLVGNIYMGKVVRVLPGMQAAFVEVGLSRAAFLHASDMLLPASEEAETQEPSSPPNITTLLSSGDKIPVQIIKDPMGSKGARLTTQLSLASRYLVYMPSLSRTGISQRIDGEEERARLKALVDNGDGHGGYIVRTIAEGVGQIAIDESKAYLKTLWAKMKADIERCKPGECIHEDLPLVLRALRDFVTPQMDRIRIDSKETYDKAVLFAKSFAPSIVNSIHLYKGARPLFDLYNIQEEVQKALARRVVLKSGGYLIIDQREALTTIDVNTGGFVGHKNLEETIFKTNLEAIQALTRQLRLRNLGGIIIIDFIDMKSEGHKEQVLGALEKGLAEDHVKTSISGVSDLGLVEMTRKRTRESLEHILCESCPSCSGRGSVKTAETVSYDIFREILRSVHAYDAGGYLVLAAQTVVDRMLDEASTQVADLEDTIGKNIKFQVESLYSQENFDVVLI